MKLGDWLRREDVRRYAFAQRVNVRPSTITRLLNGERQPGWKLAMRILEQTNGEVTPNDWLSVSEKQVAA